MPITGGGAVVGGYTYVPIEDAILGWNGVSKASQTIDLQSAPWSLPSDIKAVGVRLSFMTWDAALHWAMLSRDSGDSGVVIVRADVASQFDDAFGVVNCDASGDIYFSTDHTPNHIFLVINGYWI